MTTNGLAVIEKQFMDTVIRCIRKIADALEESNNLRKEELAEKAKVQEKLDDIIYIVKHK